MFLCDNNLVRDMKRPIITESRVAQINDLLIQNPDWNRSRLSVELCKLWGWQSPVGQIKDVSCRDMLRGLDKAGLISLPPRQRTGRITGRSSDKICIIEHNTEPIITELRNLTPLRIEIAASKEDIKTFKAYIAKYHYLSYGRSVGENMKYIIKSNTGVPIACIMFGSAAWRCKPRDEYIGWNDDERAIGLYYLTNNVRNIIFPWVRVPHLASHILGSVARRVSSDWQTKYGHPI